MAGMGVFCVLANLGASVMNMRLYHRDHSWHTLGLSIMGTAIAVIMSTKAWWWIKFIWMGYKICNCGHRLHQHEVGEGFARCTLCEEKLDVPAA